MFDTLIVNGTIVDGTGRSSYLSDLGIKDGKITTVGDLSASSAENMIDATGMIVAPGFIDIHTHSDMSLLADPRAESQIRQGVTTEVIGNCGLSLAPCTDESRETTARSMGGYSDLDSWHSYGEFLDVMSQAKTATNVVGLVGHGALRTVVMGLNAPRVATDEEVKEIVSQLERSLDEGAFGMSTGLEYHPGKMAGFDELAALCRVVAEADGLYATHSRNRDKRYFVGFGEAMDLARVTGVRLQISHVNPKYGRPDHAMRNTMQMIGWAREEGIDVAMDMMPTNWNFTSAMAQLPAWSNSLSKDDLMELLRSDEGRERLKINPLPMWQLVVEERWDKIKLMSSVVNKQYISWTIEEIARKKGSTGWDVIFDLLLEEGDGHESVVLTSEAFSEDDNRLALTSALCAIGSDTMALANDGVLKGRQLGYSGYNWTAKYMTHYLRDGEVIDLEEGIRRLTSLPASRIGLTDRGRLIPGAAADITIFDVHKIQDNSSFTDPNIYAGGFEHVIVNGVLTYSQGKRTPDHGGAVLRRN